MREFDFSPEALQRLALATLFVTGFGGLVSYLVLRNTATAILVTSAKAILFAACYVVFYDTFEPRDRPDDTIYLRQGAHLLEQLRTVPWADISLVQTAESFHFFYLMPVALAVWLFGAHYHSMVALNVALSFVCAALAFAIVNARYTEGRIARVFFVLVALNPELLAWTSFFAGKDTWVLLGHLMFIYGFVLIESGRAKSGGLWIGLATILTVNNRFYVALLMLGLIAMTMSRRTKYWLLGLAVLAMAILPDTTRALLNLTLFGIDASATDPLGVIYAIPRFWLTPRPFLTDELHGFLLVPSLINWILMPLILIGLYRCCVMRDRFTRFLALYFLAFSLMYGITDFLNGPRQRLQLVFAEMFFLWIALAFVKVLPTRFRLPIGVDDAAPGNPTSPGVAPAF